MTFVTSLEIRQLSENLQEILRVQRLFLQSLKDEISKHSHVFTSDDPDGLGVDTNIHSYCYIDEHAFGFREKSTNVDNVV